MAVEVERKFLVTSDDWRANATGASFRQGYIDTSDETTVRVRIAGDAAFLTIKGPSEGMSRAEFEYPIPLSDAQDMLRDLCRRPLIEKTRYDVSFGGKLWSVDVFGAENSGLIMAEVELDHPAESVPLPPWVGEEVTEDPRYRNSALSLSPAPGTQAP
ncbi:CYTH domain-containing protein [Azorhizobium oxalatiphilum]|uniref:CYTH domain-containing protein n=1 Tax=Azorhizobium oxalatiphilum TaxID=980631 RepID=A0A917BLQ3_9HYPH|nr:CYTH domain-containing protein [Azorhizobium oxalatiphilum]GGF51103.1 CYTH domain-containing protein [Azorhizobium oxalatiphilum]